MILSFVNYASKTTSSKPVFDKSLNLSSASHPILLYHRQKDEKPLIKNDIDVCSLSPFKIIMGANTSGKSTLIKQIALLQIMAQCNYIYLT